MANEVKISPMATVSASKDYVTVLSIGDEPTSTQTLLSNLHMDDTAVDSRGNSYFRYVPSYTSGQQPSCSQSSEKQQRRRDDEIVEVSGHRNSKKNGLHVVGASPKQARRIEFDETSSRSRAKSYHESRIGSPKDAERFKRVHKSGFFGGLPENFVEEIDDLLPEAESENIRAQRIVLSPETFGVPTGIQITEVPDPNNPGRLLAVEVYRIEENQRISLDGQLQVGDRIIKINSRPVYQMSLTAARLYIDELKREEEPSIVFYRLSKVDSNKNDSNLQTKPVTVMVQQGNTTALHNLKEISITKGSGGFGFHFASRPSECGNIFLVTHVIPDSASDELLLSGDRLLKIGETDLADLIQSDVRELLKTCSIGETLIFQISRTEDAEETTEQPHTSIQSTSDEISGLEADDQILEFRIPVNEAAAAGLGLALKGKQKIGRDGQQNAAVFIDRILRGSAAYKDGRLLEDDRILGIENLNLLQFAQNSEAAQAFNSYVSSLPPSCAYFKIFIARKPENIVDQSSIMSRKAFIAWMADIKTDSARLAETIKNANEEQLGSVEGRRKSTTTSQDEDTTKLGKREMAEDAISIASVQQVDPFNRESASRKSFSEKGPFGKRDTTKFENFKQISHQRQISAPIIGHRRHRAQLIRQRSAVILKNNTNENRQEEQKTEAPTNNTDPNKQKGFSFLSFFGLRNSISKGSSANKENVQNDENAQNAKRRSMSEGPDKGENRLRTSASHHEKLSPAADLSSPSNAAAREALRKKRRSVGTSMFKFFQKADSPSKLSPNENDISQTEQRKLHLDYRMRSPGNVLRAEISPQLRPLSSIYHRRFNSAHDGLKNSAWSPTNQRIDIADPKYSGTSPDKQSGSRRRMQTSSHSFKQQRPSVTPFVAGSTEYHNAYNNAFNKWFKAVQNPRYDDSVPSRYMPADSSMPFYPAPPAYSSIQSSKSSTAPNFDQRYTAAYPNFWPQPFCSVQYSPPYPTQAPTSTYGQPLYFGGMPQTAAYPIDFNYHEPQRRLSTRSAPKFSTNQPFDVHVERF